MTWWRRLWHGRELEDQLDKELRFYLDQHTADLIMRGFSPQEARRRAWLALGGPEQVKESCRDARGTRWVEDLRLDGKYALRTLRQKPGFAAAALLTFSLGIGSTTVMFTILDGVLLKPLPFPEPEKLLSVHLRNEKLGEFWGTPTPIFSTTSASCSAWWTGCNRLRRPHSRS